MTVVSCDMRTWDPPEKADIIVSELLGSFGDNELSPECLDGADRFLKGGVSFVVSNVDHLRLIFFIRYYWFHYFMYSSVYVVLVLSFGFNISCVSVSIS